MFQSPPKLAFPAQQYEGSVDFGSSVEKDFSYMNKKCAAGTYRLNLGQAA